MELGFSFNDVMDKYSWINLRLLSIDKVKYVGEDNIKRKQKELSRDEEFALLSKMSRNG